MKVSRRIVSACQVERIEQLEIQFKSRKAVFIISTSEYKDFDDFAVSFRVGPIGISLRPDEAKALGQALIDSVRHYEGAKFLKSL